MDVLLREVHRRSDGRTEYIDTEIGADPFTLGAAPENSVQLLGSGIHARLGTIVGSTLECLGGAQIVHNGERTSKATLVVGDVVEIDGHRLRVIDAPSGFDLALELERDTDVDPSAYEAAFRTDLEQTWLRKRRPAVYLLLLVLVLGLLAPYALRKLDVDGPLLPTDVMWSSGPLLPAHRLAIGDDCSKCHVQSFVMVRDQACRECHGSIADHFHRTLAGVDEIERCASCHREHNEPATLVVTDDALCTDCHASSQSSGNAGEVEAVTGFDTDRHPSFEAHLLKSVSRPAGTGFAYDWRFEVAEVASAVESSNLEFPHDVHLDPEKVRSISTSAALVCRDCHRLSQDEEHFEPITMERHCRSCHDLKFDETDPERELPHGEPIEAILAIEGHYLKKYSDPEGYKAERAKRRLPDRLVEDERCTGAAYACATRKTLAEAINQFTVRGCVTCHAVEDNGNQDVYSRFQVLPIRLAADYFPAARFDHVSHMTQKDASGDAACLTCHRADSSAQSADLLIPDIDSCVQCHSDASRGDRVVLACVDCHAYHPGAALTALREMEPL